MFSAILNLLARLASWFLPLIGATAAQFAGALGFGIAAFSGFHLLINKVMAEAMKAFAGLPSDIIQLLGYMWLDVALNIQFSGIVLLLTIRGVTSAGRFTRPVWNKPGTPWGA